MYSGIRKSTTHRFVAASVVVVASFGITVGWGAMSGIQGTERHYVRQWKIHCKCCCGRAFVALYRVIGLFHEDRAGPFTPLQGAQFRYEDLSNPYFERVRLDHRLSPLYTDSAFTFQVALKMSDALRGLFPHGSPTMPAEDIDILEMLDLTERGKRFNCGAVAKMYVQVIQAARQRARRVFLRGHVVAEVWAPDMRRWVMIDPYYNVHFVNRPGWPLSVLDIHRMLNAGEANEIVIARGRAPGTLFSREADQLLFPGYSPGFAVSFYDKWVSCPLPRWDPHRLPLTSSVYYSESREQNDLEGYFVFRTLDPAILYRPPCSS